MMRILLCLLVASSLVACASVETLPNTPDAPAAPRRGGSSYVLDTASGAQVTLEQVADELAATADVVFLGELHDSGPCHAFQIALTELLFERRGTLAIAMEQFERDQQADLDRYLAGEYTEDEFLNATRTWPNYEDYRPAIELARREGLPVLAANVPRPLASRVVKEGINAVLGEEYTPWTVHVGAGEYRDRFYAFAGVAEAHLATARTANFFAAQCIKDDAMAESIATFLTGRSAPRPLVVHWCGAFHSDYGLGTVERLRTRMPHLRFAVLSTTRPEDMDAPLDEGELTKGRWLFVVSE